MAIGALNVNVAANAARATKSIHGFRSAVRGAKADTSIAGRAVAGFQSKLTGLASGLAASAAAYASVSTFKSIADDLDATGEAAERLGVAGQSLLELRHAAQMTGVGADLLDKSLGKMNLTVAQAAAGAGKGGDALAELGLSVKDLQGLTPDVQFAKISEALSGVASQNEKARLATALFGKSARELLPTLDLGASGLASMGAEQRKLMGVMSDSEIAKVAAFNDELDRLSAVMVGIGRELVIDIAPHAMAALEFLRKELNLAKFYGMSEKEAGGLTEAEKSNHAAAVAKAKKDASGLEHLDGDAFDLALQTRQAWKQVFTKGGDAFKGVAEGATGKVAEGFAFVGQALNAGQSKLAAMQRQGVANMLAGLNPLTGLRAVESEREMAPKVKPLGPVSDRINSLVEADSKEGYMALRANQRTARLNPADKAAPKIETNTKATADALRKFVDWAMKGPPPASA